MTGKLCHYSFFFFILHFFQHKVWVKDIQIVHDIFPVPQQIYFNGFVESIHDPIFRNAAGLIDIFFMPPVSACGAGGEHLNHQVGRAMDAVALDLVFVTDNHAVWNKMVRFG